MSATATHKLNVIVSKLSATQCCKSATATLIRVRAGGSKRTVAVDHFDPKWQQGDLHAKTHERRSTGVSKQEGTTW